MAGMVASLNVALGLPPRLLSWSRRSAWFDAFLRMSHVLGDAPRLLGQPLSFAVELLRPVVPCMRVVDRRAVIARQNDPGQNIHRDGQATRHEGRSNPHQPYERGI